MCNAYRVHFGCRQSNGRRHEEAPPALDYWGVGDIDQPIGIVPFPCGGYVCPNHGDDQGETATTCEPSVA